MSGPVVIVGGGPAALATARAYREAGGDRDVVMLTADDRPPYRRPPLTKELPRGELGESELPMVPEGWYAHGPGRPGARQAGPDGLPRGGDRGGLHRLRGGRLAGGAGPGGDPPRARLPQEERLGEEVAAILAGWLRDDGVRLLMGTEVVSVGERAGGLVVRTGEGGEVRADLAVLGAGARPLTAVAESAGLRVEEGAVPVDDRPANHQARRLGRRLGPGRARRRPGRVHRPVRPARRPGRRAHHGRDRDDERGRELVEAGAPL